MGVSFLWNGDRARGAILQAVAARMDNAGKAGVALARELVPVDTGKLRDSIGYVFVQDTMTVMLHADMFYSAFVELGTVQHEPRPYLRPGIQAAAEALAGTGAGAAGTLANPEEYGGQLGLLRQQVD